MCDAGSMFTVASTALTVGASIWSGNQQAEDAKQAAWIARQNAAMVYNKAAVEQSRITDAEQRASGGITTYFAAGNLDPAMGSPLMLQAFSAGQANIDRELVMASAHQDAAGYYQQAASLYRKADQARMAGYVGAAGALLKGASSWASGKSFGGGGSGGASSAVAPGASIDFTNPSSAFMIM